MAADRTFDGQLIVRGDVMSDEAFARLQSVRQRWDPDNRFATYLATNTSPLNQNHWEVT